MSSIDPDRVAAVSPRGEVWAETGRPSVRVASLGFTHPKNYLGVPLAVASERDTGGVIMASLVDMAGKAREGAKQLGLISPTGALTWRGQQVVATAEGAYGSVDEALNVFGELKGSTTRFVEACPEWTSTLQHLLWHADPVRAILATVIEDGPLTLVELVDSLLAANADAVTAFRRGTAPVSESGGHREAAWYSGAAVYQLKSLCYHAGLLTERGADTARLDPESDCWEATQTAEVMLCSEN